MEFCFQINKNPAKWFPYSFQGSEVAGTPFLSALAAAELPKRLRIGTLRYISCVISF